MQLKKQIQSLFRLPYFWIVITPFALLAPVLFTGKAFFWGIPSLQFVPWWKWAFDTLLSGHWPLWNPLLGMGAPLIANYQSALFYPPYWLYFIFYMLGGIGGLAWSQALIVALHIAWGGIGMALLVRRLGMGSFAQTVSGLVFSLSGFVVARGCFFSINSVVIWLPWILLFAYDLARVNSDHPEKTSLVNFFSKGRISTILKLGLVIGMQLLAGHAQLTWYSLLLAALWIGYWSWVNRTTEFKNKYSSLFGVINSWISFAGAAFLGFCLAAVQLLPTAEYLLQSQRAAEIDYEAAMTYSFWPWRFLGFFAPDLFGNPVRGDFWGYATYWEDAIYIGLLPILLALGVLLRAVFKRKSKTDSEPAEVAVFNRRSLAIFLLVIIFFSFLFALGDNTPVFPWLYKNVPTFDMFKSPTRFSIWGIFSLSLLAGVGVENWHRPTGRGLYWTRLSIAGAFAITLGAGFGWFLFRTIPDFHISFVRAMALAGFWAIGVGVLSVLAPERGQSDEKYVHRWQLAVVLWITVDLLVAGWGLNPGIELDFYTQKPTNEARVSSMVAEGRVLIPVEDEDVIKYDQYFIFESFDSGKDWYELRGTFLPNLNVFSGIPMVNNYDPMVPGRYARWMESISDLDIQTRDDLLDLMTVTVIQTEDATGDFGVHFDPRDSVHRLNWVPCAEVAKNEDSALAMVLSGDVDFKATVILENAQPTLNIDCTSQTGIATIQNEETNQIDIQVESKSPGWLVLSDVWYPGWRANIDGEAAEIFRANYLFRAIKIPPGEHVVSFVYQPIWFAMGLAASMLTCLILMMVVVILKRMR